jgi:beta-xylosidase
MPDLPLCDFTLAQSDEFDTPQISLQWFLHCNSEETNSGWSLSERPGWLRIQPRAGKPMEKRTLPGVIVQRVIDKQFQVSTRVVFDPTGDDQAAGLCLYHDPNMNIWLATTQHNNEKVIEVGKTNKGKRTSLWTVKNKIGADVRLRIDVDGEESATFYYSTGIGEWTKLGESIYFGSSGKDLRDGRCGDPDLGWVGINKSNRWSATTLGVFAAGSGNTPSPPADFDFVHVTTRPKE